MAVNKTKNNWAALIHAIAYTLCFVPLWLNHQWSGVVIFVSHFLIDRFSLAKYVVFAKNHLGMNPSWADCRATGYPSSTPVWLAVWLLIVADNTLHLTINYLALRY